MNDRPTPETDAKKWIEVGYKSYVVSASVAKKLERERDEARKLLGTPLSVAISERNDALHALTGWENKWKAAVEMAAKAEIERDEARKHLQAMADKAKELITRWDQPSWKDTAPTAGFIYALRDAVEAYEKQKP